MSYVNYVEEGGECLNIPTMDNVDIDNGIATLSKVLFFQRLERTVSIEYMLRILQVQESITEYEARQLLCNVAIRPTFDIEDENIVENIIGDVRNMKRSIRMADRWLAYDTEALQETAHGHVRIQQSPSCGCR